MKIYAICLVRNEVDIIDITIKEAKQWVDKLLLIDNGSDDGTWERIQAWESEQVVPVERTTAPYADALRSHAFKAFKNEMKKGDWWAIQDADEFFYENPRKFLPQIASKYHAVASKKVDRRLPKECAENTQASETPSIDPKGFPYFAPFAWSEIRFFRHRPRLQWPEGMNWPRRVGIVAPEKIRVEHYPFRSLEQVNKKYKEKIAVHREDPRFFRHISQAKKGTDLLSKKDQLLYDDGEQDIFQRVRTKNDLTTRSYKYLIKRILHGLRIWP